MQKSELISVIMPAYNAARFIAQSIESVLDQTYTNWELIIVDDGSTDNTKEIVSDFEKKDSRIKYIYQRNGKQGKARNKGIENAKGELIAFLDAEDILIPTMLEKQLALLHETKADLVFSSVKYVDEQMNELKNIHSVHSKILQGIHGAEMMLKHDNCIPIITVLSKKETIKKAGAFKVSDKIQFGEEFDLWLRMLLNDAKFVSNDERLALYKIHPQQSSKLAENKYFQVLKLIRELPASQDFKKQKDVATCIWIRRCLKFSKNLDKKKLRKLINFIPSFYARNISLLASYVLPYNLLKKTIHKLSYHR